jgi:lysophospholipase L1-like esterase
MMSQISKLVQNLFSQVEHPIFKEHLMSAKKLLCGLLVNLLFLAASLNGEALESDSNIMAKNIADHKQFSLWTIRESLSNCRKVFLSDGKGRVAFLGGSITANAGWRDHTCGFLQTVFPNTEFDFINAGIGGTNSTFGAARLEEHVFAKGKVDILFLEYAVNDGASSPDNRPDLAMEGIIRHARRLNPQIDIIILYFGSQEMVKSLREGKQPGSIIAHEKIAEYYNISSLNLALDLTRRLDANEFSWQQFSSDSCHPLPFGGRRYSETINKFLVALLAKPSDANLPPAMYKTPTPLNATDYENGCLITLDHAQNLVGWTRNSEWTTQKTCNFVPPVDVIEATKPGSSLEFSFKGSTVAIYAIAGMDAGILECSIDNGPVIKIDMFDQFCPRFHRPVFRILEENLKVTHHVLKITLSEDKNQKSTGTAVRILRFACF